MEDKQRKKKKDMLFEAERALTALLSCKTEHNRDMAIIPSRCSREMIEKIYEGYE